VHIDIDLQVPIALIDIGGVLEEDRLPITILYEGGQSQFTHIVANTDSFEAIPPLGVVGGLPVVRRRPNRRWWW